MLIDAFKIALQKDDFNIYYLQLYMRIPEK